jgi:hypothetical protein
MIGQTISHYKILEKFVCDGMGVVCDVNINNLDKTLQGEIIARTEDYGF